MALTLEVSMADDQQDDWQMEEAAPQPVKREEDDRARITLIDIMACVTIGAVNAALWLQDFADSNLPSLYVVVECCLFISFTLGVTGLFLFARRWFQGKKTDFQPGHWILCLVGSALVLQTVMSLIRRVFREALEFDIDGVNTLLLLILAVQVMVEVLLSIGVGILLPVRRHWRWWLVFVVLAGCIQVLVLFSYILQLYNYSPIFSSLSFANTIVAIGVLVGLAIWDYATKEGPRNELHWVGIFVGIIDMVPTILIYFMNMM
ncbi:hypothetical protein [Bremerella cremea]|uniref:hypothetical protein n=1 Tax=Bremerella cremea TaxID=1031537 RepID=UPI0031EB5AB1